MVFILQLIGIAVTVIFLLALIYHIFTTMLDFVLVSSVILLSFSVGMHYSNGYVGLGMFTVFCIVAILIVKLDTYLNKVKVMSEESLSSLVARKFYEYKQKELMSYGYGMEYLVRIEEISTKELALRLRANSLKLQNYSLVEIQESLSKMQKEITKEEYIKLGGNTNPALMKTEIHNGVWVYYKNTCLIR